MAIRAENEPLVWVVVAAPALVGVTLLLEVIDPDLAVIELDNHPPSAVGLVKQVDIERLEREVSEIEDQKQALETKKPVDLKQMRAKLAHLLEHFGQAMKNQSNPAHKARLFGLLFDKLPTYADLKVGTKKGGVFPGVNPIFRPDAVKAFNLAPGTGFEPAT